MIATKRQNDRYLDKVDDIVNLFKWNHPLKQGFPSLPTECIVVSEVVDRYKGLDNEAYMHHATIARRYGKIYMAYTIHDYDEDASGQITSISVSEDEGLTWQRLNPAMPQLSPMAAWGTYPAQWSYPSQFLHLPSGFYIFINTVDGIVDLEYYQPLGSLIRKINPDNTYGELFWVNNGISANDRTIPTPYSGYPSYNFASEELIEETVAYLSNPMLRPKILFGWPEIWSVQEDYIGNGNPLREPTEIKPYNYDEVLKVWKISGINYNIVQNREDNSTQTVSELPNATGSPAKRFYNYSPEIIISVGHSQKTNRQELMLFIARKNNVSGQYEIADGDVYSVSDITKSSPVYPGHAKNGGEQLAFINRVGKDYLDIGFSVAKEEIYFKTINVSILI